MSNNTISKENTVLVTEENTMKKMISVVDFCREFYGKDVCLYKEKLLKEAKQIVIDFLNDESSSIHDGETFDEPDTCFIYGSLARDENMFGVHDKGIGDVKKCKRIFCDSHFPMDEFKEWLSSYGWSLGIENDEGKYDFTLEGELFVFD